MPDEHSNLKSPAPAGRPSNRRRGRRGGRGRGRGPRPPGEKPTEEISNAPENAEAPEAHDQTEAEEPENTGGFREPHAEVPADFAAHEAEPAEASATESAAENSPAPEVSEPRPAPVRPREFPQREQREPREPREPREQRAPQPRSYVPPAQRQWVKPADFRPAESTAIHEAVAHATFIANALKELHEQMDEILELVEVAERQKLADERELDELRRALRRIQPQNRPSPPPTRGQRRDEPRQSRPEPRENVQRHEEPARPPEAEEPPAPAE